jgi:peptidoglycan/xylan/chitin deacetylase (PgdA/CDA1 family)
MATINVGIAPPSATSEVGKLRFLLNDIESVPLDPVVAGYGNYTNFSDSELEALIAQSGDNHLRAVGFAYIRLAAVAASEAIDWKSDDQSVMLSKRADALRKIAEMWFDQADAADAVAGSSFFAIEYPFGNPYATSSYYSIAEVEELEALGFGRTPFGSGAFGA